MLPTPALKALYFFLAVFSAPFPVSRFPSLLPEVDGAAVTDATDWERAEGEKDETEEEGELVKITVFVGRPRKSGP